MTPPPPTRPSGITPDSKPEMVLFLGTAGFNLYHLLMEEDSGMQRKRIALLIGGGSCVPWVLEVLDSSKVEVVLGITHRKVAHGLTLLRQAGVNTFPFL